jgi:hypothetical protein
MTLSKSLIFVVVQSAFSLSLCAETLVVLSSAPGGVNLTLVKGDQIVSTVPIGHHPIYGVSRNIIGVVSNIKTDNQKSQTLLQIYDSNSGKLVKKYPIDSLFVAALEGPKKSLVIMGNGKSIAFLNYERIENGGISYNIKSFGIEDGKLSTLLTLPKGLTNPELLETPLGMVIYGDDADGVYFYDYAIKQLTEIIPHGFDYALRESGINRADTGKSRIVFIPKIGLLRVTTQGFMEVISDSLGKALETFRKIEIPANPVWMGVTNLGGIDLLMLGYSTEGSNTIDIIRPFNFLTGEAFKTVNIAAIENTIETFGDKVYYCDTKGWLTSLKLDDAKEMKLIQLPQSINRFLGETRIIHSIW